VIGTVVMVTNFILNWPDCQYDINLTMSNKID